MLRVPQLKKLQQQEPYLYEALKEIVGAVNALSRRVGSDATGPAAAPAAIGSLSVVAANGLFDIAITDNSPVGRGINYFIEYDTSPAFSNPIVVPLGPSRNGKLFLGNLTLYFRGYSQYIGSAIGPKVSYGSPPAAVTGGGPAPPPPQPSQGSGTGGGGFGDFTRGCCEIGTALCFPADARVETRVEPCDDWVELETETGRKLRMARHTLVSTFTPVERLEQGALVETEAGHFERVKRVKRVQAHSHKIVVQVTPHRIYWGNGIRLHNLKAAPL